MSAAFLKSELVPRPVSAMINAGERSGRLCETLDHAAAFAEEELDSAIKAATSLIEPIMILGMGIVVGGIAAAMLLPIFGLSKSIHT
jgi:type IV pilus assembly protein PilC